MNTPLSEFPGTHGPVQGPGAANSDAQTPGLHYGHVVFGCQGPLPLLCHLQEAPSPNLCHVIQSGTYLTQLLQWVGT